MQATSLRLVALVVILALATASARADLLVSNRLGNAVARYNETTGAFQGNFVTAGAGGVSQPVGMRRGPDGNIYVAAQNAGPNGDGQILRYNGATGAFIDVFASDGLAQPSDLDFGPDGDLYVANFGGATVERYNPQTGAHLGSFASGGGLSAPTALRFSDDGFLYVSSFSSDQVLRYSATSGAFDKIFIDSTNIATPAGQVVGPDGNLYVVDLVGGNIERFNAVTGAPIDTFATGLSFPAGAMLDRDGALLVTELGDLKTIPGRVMRFDLSNGSSTQATGPGGLLLLPSQMLLLTYGDANGDGLADGADYTVWADNFNLPGTYNIAQGDYNGDGKVDGADYTVWADNFTPGAAAAALAIPEPTTGALALLGGLTLLLAARRRRA
jgi:sugar lactone lactonase YvrE